MQSRRGGDPCAAEQVLVRQPDEASQRRAGPGQRRQRVLAGQGRAGGQEGRRLPGRLRGRRYPYRSSLVNDKVQ